MKVQNITQNNTNANKAPQFRGAIDGTLRYLATNQAVGANVVDLSFMVIPRTANDTIRRGPLAGMETGRREASGTVNHSLIGVYGAGAGALVAAIMGIDRKFGTKSNEIMAAPETINILAQNKSEQLIDGKLQKDYLRKTLKGVKAFNPTSAKADKDGFVRISDKTIEEIIDILDDVINDKDMNFKKWSSKKTNNSLDVVLHKITEDTGAQSKYILEFIQEHLPAADGSKAEEVILKNSETNLRTLLEDIYKVSEAFNKKNVIDAFKKQTENKLKVLENEFIKSLTKYGKIKSIAGFAIGSAIGMSIQPINMYLTKKKTGQDGFVGVEGRSKDTSFGFKILKTGSAAAFFAMVLSTLNPERTGLKKISPKGFMSKMAFKGFWPTLSQLKAIYGLTIISRLFVARDKDELRESLTKDTLGFLSWLVLGDFVNKMVAEGLDKKLEKSVMNRTKEVAGKGYWSRVFNSSLKNRDEVLIEALAENGISTVKKDGDKIIAKSFKELLAELDKLPEAVRNLTKKRLSTLNKAQLAGYAFSGLVLGLGIPNLNIYITNKLDKKHKAQLAEQQKLAMVKA